MSTLSKAIVMSLATALAVGVVLAVPAAAFGWPAYVPGGLAGVVAGAVGALALRRKSTQA